MAKKGIEYFPLVCYMDDSFELLEAEFGLMGFAVIIKLFQKIYGGEGYFCRWTKEVSLLFAKKNGFFGTNKKVSTCDVDKIVDRALDRGIFSREAFEKHSILTSESIQKTFFLITKRRKELEINPEYIVLEEDICGDKKEDDKTKENACNLKQRKVKGREVKKSEAKGSEGNGKEQREANGEEAKEREIEAKAKEVKKREGKENLKPATHAPSNKKCFGKYKNVFLTEEEHAELIASFGEEKTKLCISFLDEYIEDKGYTHKDSFLSIKRWVITAVLERLRKNEAEKGTRPQEKSKFVNYTQREWDFEKLEELDRKMLEEESKGFDFK